MSVCCVLCLVEKTGDDFGQPARVLDFGTAPRLPRSQTKARGIARQTRHVKPNAEVENDSCQKQDEGDVSTTYTTKAVTKLVGRTISIDLAEALDEQAICQVRELLHTYHECFGKR